MTTAAAAGGNTRPLRVLTIGGLDPTGGAGIAADLKTIAAHGAWGTAALTAVTVQDTCRLHRVSALAPDLVAEQISAALCDIGTDAIKIGMLASAAIVARLARLLEERLVGVPIVLDPVLAAGVGGALLDDEAIAVLKHSLMPLAAIVTPNAPELARLTGLAVDDARSLERAARQLIDDTGACAVFAKAGHLTDAVHRDLLITANGETAVFESPHLADPAHHGTGCTFASALACGLAAGRPLVEAASAAHKFVQQALRSGHRDLGAGAGPVEPCWRWR